MPDSKRIKVALFHFNPVELFPPAMNMLDDISRHSDRLEFCVYTLEPPARGKQWVPEQGSKVRIVRMPNMSGKNIVWRFAGYIMYYLWSFFHCLLWIPDRLFYIESMSAPGPLLLKKWLFQNKDLYIHYHEYMSPDDYERSSFLNRIYNMEKSIYSKACWISHTNNDRMDLFLRDVGLNSDNKCRIMPNFPSLNWAAGNARNKAGSGWPVKLVYVGAVDLVNLYFPEIIHWTDSQGGRYTLDVLSNQDTSELEKYLENMGSVHVKVLPGRPYHDLPAILKGYDVGVILYRSYSENFRFNAPNKLFEYLACGLDVWFPETLQGIVPYIRKDKHPMVLPLDFSDFSSSLTIIDSSRNNHVFEPTSYYCEPVYQVLRESLVRSN